MLAIKLISGALIGTALKIACDFIEQRLLLRRNITYSQSRNERIILHIIMALIGAIIMWKPEFFVYHNIQFHIINDLRSNRCDRPASQNYTQ